MAAVPWEIEGEPGEVPLGSAGVEWEAERVGSCTALLSRKLIREAEKHPMPGIWGSRGSLRVCFFHKTLMFTIYFTSSLPNSVFYPCKLFWLFFFFNLLSQK